MTANALFEAERTYNTALEDDRDRAMFERHTNITLLNGDHASGKVHLNLSNSGGTVLDVSLASLFFDGVWKTDQITSRTVDGVTTDYWAPSQTLYLKATSASPPGRAFFVVETGAGVVWEP